MATFSANWETEQADGNLTAASVTTGTNGATCDGSAHLAAVHSVDANFPVSPTDDLIVEVQTSPDGGTDWDDTPIMSFRIDNGTDPNQKSFLISPLPPTYRIHVKRSGSTDTITVTHTYKRMNITSA